MTFTESFRGGVDAPAVVLALDVRGDIPEGVAVIDLARPPSPREWWRRSRLGARVLPQAWDQARARAPGATPEASSKGVGASPGISCQSVLGLRAKRGRSKARPGGIEEGSGRTGASRARSVRVRRHVGGAVLSEDRAPSGRFLSAAHQGDCSSDDPRAEVARTRRGSSAAESGSRPRARPVIEVFTTRPDVRSPEGARRSPCRDRRHGDDRGALGDAPLSPTCPHRRLDGPRGLRDGHARGAGVERHERLRALEQSCLRRGQPGEHRRFDPPARPVEDGGIDPADRIATLADYQAIDFSGSPNTIDAAIALTTAGDVGTSTLPDGYGSPSSTTVPASVGMRFRSTGERPDSRPDRSTRSTSTLTSATSR